MDNKRDIITSPRVLEIKRHKKRIIFRRFFLFFILFISIIIGLAYFSGSSRFLVKDIKIVGNKVIDSKKVEMVIKETLKGRYFYLFKRANALIYPKAEIEANITKFFPRIKALKVYKENWFNIVVDISERSGSYLYCGQNIPEEKNDIGDNCYFVNDEGYVFDRAPYFSGNVYFKFYIANQYQGDELLGRDILPTQEFVKLINFIEEIESLGFKPIILDLNKEDEYYLFLEGISDPKIIFKKDNDLDSLFVNLSSAMNEKKFREIIKNNYNTLSYIDLRYKNKVL